MQSELGSDEISVSAFPKISVFGVGGAGINSVNSIIASQIDNIKFVAANTDCQSLMNSFAETKIQLGEKCTKGLGAGSKPEVGKQAAEEACDIIKRELSGIDMLFISTGVGGGTGTGASPVIAKMAKDMGILTVVIAIKPFVFEGKKRMETANIGIKELENIADTLIVIENQKLMEMNNISIFDNYAIVNKILEKAICCVVNILLTKGVINRDFADIKTVLSSAGRAVIGYSEDVDPMVATENAIRNQVLENNSIRGAKNILLNISGNKDMTTLDIENIVNKVKDEARINEDDDPNVIFGIANDKDIGNNIRVSVIAAGVEKNNQIILNTDNKVYQREEQGNAKKQYNQIQNDTEDINNKDQKIEAPFFVKPLDEDSLANDESFNLKTEEIQETEKNISQFKNTFFSDSEKLKNNKTKRSETISTKIQHNDENNKKSIGLFDDNKQHVRSKSILLKLMNYIGSMPEIGNKNYDENNEEDENKNNEDDIYNTPTIKRKIG